MVLWLAQIQVQNLLQWWIPLKTKTKNCVGWSGAGLGSILNALVFGPYGSVFRRDGDCVF